MLTNVHFWAFFVVWAAGIACRVPLCHAITWLLGPGGWVVGLYRHQPAVFTRPLPEFREFLFEILHESEKREISRNLALVYSSGRVVGPVVPCPVGWDVATFTACTDV